MYTACETCRFWTKDSEFVAMGYCQSIDRKYRDDTDIADDIGAAVIISDSYDAMLLTGAHFSCDYWKPKS